jgi:hypothetical protein
MHLLEVQAMKNPTHAKVIAAIQNSGGSLAVAAAAIHMSRHQLAERIVRTPALLEFVEKGDDMASRTIWFPQPKKELSSRRPGPFSTG